MAVVVDACRRGRGDAAVDVVVGAPVPRWCAGVLGADEPKARPMPGHRADQHHHAPATMPMTAPWRHAPSRDRPGPSPGGAGRPASQVSRAGAPAAPASTSGVQAKRKTMSEPVK